jgi:hypothetical protein
MLWLSWAAEPNAQSSITIHMETEPNACSIRYAPQNREMFGWLEYLQSVSSRNRVEGGTGRSTPLDGLY